MYCTVLFTADYCTVSVKALVKMSAWTTKYYFGKK